MTGKKIELVRVRVQDVGIACIMLVSKFSRAIHAKHGVVIRLHQPHVLNTVAAYAALIEDEQLRSIYQLIENEIRQHLKAKHPNNYDQIEIRYNKKIALQSREIQQPRQL